MPKFKVEQKSQKSSKESYVIIKEFLLRDADIQKIDPKMKSTFNDDNMTCSLVGNQFKADVVISSLGKEGSHVTIMVDLSLILTPFKGKVAESLQKKLVKYLG